MREKTGETCHTEGGDGGTLEEDVRRSDSLIESPVTETPQSDFTSLFGT